MSLIRQLWLVVLISTLLAFAGSLFIGVWSAREYLAQQLERKNADNASSLALAMTQQEKDPVNIELQVAALFDTGYYQEISVTDPLGKPIVQRLQDRSETDVPGWFVNLLPIPSRPGLAQVSDGWKQYATVKVVSHTHFAYAALWGQLEQLLLWFALGGGAVGMIGMLGLRSIARSLGDVVGQAEAIGNRRFVSIAEPRTPELRALTRAMNAMVERVRLMFAEATGRLEDLQRRLNYDPLTGLQNREHFMVNLREQLSGNESAQQGALALLRLTDLDEINARLGRSATDALLRDVGNLFRELAGKSEGGLAGRVKAGEFALLLPGAASAADVARQLADSVDKELAVRWVALPELYHLGALQYERGDRISGVLSELDAVLAVAAESGSNSWHAVDSGSLNKIIPGEQWKTLLTQAVDGGKLSLVFYPVVRDGGASVHQEGMIRLQADVGVPPMKAADFMPIAAHLNLTAPIDMAVVRLAIGHLEHISEDIAVNLSSSTLGNWSFHHDLCRQLQASPELCRRLWFEVPEYGAFKHFDAFRELCHSLKELGCRIGIESFGQRLAESDKLTELGLDYVKLHPGLVQGLAGSPGNREFLQRFCGVAHNLGIIVIATGVRSADDLAQLKALGVDGATGPGVARTSD
ncbi:EAL domain-containing protein [Rhodocyclus tenuis]|uniref:bifunctional diguanylate cyclase/phosphodiesterase n=1 Tax=Rhodocyclus tenuis TaxID=1066 RepID=UPI0019075F3D|nr:EAL domain-containing protein [Rhodocyclus tenuis]MBK1681479.1 GGDEF domain-containing protein [Rhodocyclus tenuis]